MSRTEVRKIVKEYANRLKLEAYPFSAIYLFGSFAKGNAHRWSDIDVAVVSKEMTKGHWRGQLKLRRLKRLVDDRIEPHGFSPEDFKQDWMPMVHEIKKTGIRIV